MNDTVYALLLYPSHGAPRVVALPAAPPGMPTLMNAYATESAAAAALESFLVANPEYRCWRDGRIEEPAP